MPCEIWLVLHRQVRFVGEHVPPATQGIRQQLLLLERRHGLLTVVRTSLMQSPWPSSYEWMEDFRHGQTQPCGSWILPRGVIDTLKGERGFRCMKNAYSTGRRNFLFLWVIQLEVLGEGMGLWLLDRHPTLPCRSVLPLSRYGTC